MKTKKLFFPTFLVLLMFFCASCGCNNSEKSADDASRDYEGDRTGTLGSKSPIIEGDSTSTITYDSNYVRADTSWADTYTDSLSIGRNPAAVPAEPSSVKKSAVLGYSYIPEMKPGEIKNVNVYISATNPTSFIIDTLKEIIQNQVISNPKDTSIAVLTTQQIDFYKYLTVTLMSFDSAFAIKAIHDGDRQEISSLYDNRWRWTIKALSEEKEGLLIIKVEAETPEGVAKPLKDINIPIRVNVRTDIVRTTWIFLTKNPEFFLTFILIPLAVYFGKRLFERKKAKP